VYVRKHPETAAKVRDREDVRRATATVAPLAIPRAATLTTWLWLDMVGDERRDKALQSLKAEPSYLDSLRVSYLLNPKSADHVLRTWLLAQGWG